MDKQATETKRLTSADARKRFLEIFRKLCYSRNSWQVWADFIVCTGYAIANSHEMNPETRKKREDIYKERLQQIGGIDTCLEMLTLIGDAYTANPEQDFLGEIFMELGLGNHWKGQFFTPYNICKMMSMITMGNMQEELGSKPWISVNDCACGAGALLIAAANYLKDNDVNYHTKALFVAQDIDLIAGLMCYIQLSVLGCAGYVVIADSLCHPVTGGALNPVCDGCQDIFYTPMFSHEIWQYRKLIEKLEILARPADPAEESA